MTWWLPHRFEEKRDHLLARARMMQAIRRFFDAQGFLEVQTPALQVCPTMDMHIHAFETLLVDHDFSPRQTFFLHTSPELDMKKLLVAGLPRIYQICPVFRNAEISRLHSPEFTLLEWYRAGADYQGIMADCEALLRVVAQDLGIAHYQRGDVLCDPFAVWERLSVVRAFKEYADIELCNYLEDTQSFAQEVERQGIRVAQDDRWDDLFFRVMAQKIEPHLGARVPTILYDYPASMAALSRPSPQDPRFAERFELYVCGVELANAFSELTDVDLQRQRFMVEMQEKQKLYGITYPADEEFFRALEYGLPESGGIALGLDRLIMLARGAARVQDVQWAQIQTG